ncbi:hypothetical protein Tco_0921969 [Tanacetum coccineum]|uniref:Uncharacterized protein n=1 Tax=Tanacetum coccineum TaxID=301880 RepID=A0ABQ5CWT4_9ASTR
MPLFQSPEPTVSCLNDLDFFKDYEDEFPAIVYNDALTSKSDFSTEPTLNPQHIDEFDLNDETSLFEYMAIPPRDQRHQYLRFEGLQYNDVDVAYFEARLARIYRREDADEAQRCSGAEFGEAVLELDTAGALQFRLIACSIAGRSQAPEKVTVIDLFYLGGMDVDSVNIPYLLARLQGLTVIAPTLPVIDMAELARLQICKEIDDTWAWVAQGPERQQDATTGASEVAEDAPVIDEGAPAVLAPAQAPQPPLAPRTMPHRMTRLEEDVHEIRGALGEQRERRIRQRTGEASTSTAQQDEQQPDP